MRSINLARLVAAAALLFAIANDLSAQDTAQAGRPKHHRHKFVDLGTFGGPDSIIPFIQRVLTRQGTVIGTAETDIPDPLAPPCASPNCKVQRGFELRKGVMTQLPVLSAYGESETHAVTLSGAVVGVSQNGLIDPVSG